MTIISVAFLFETQLHSARSFLSSINRLFWQVYSGGKSVGTCTCTCTVTSMTPLPPMEHGKKEKQNTKKMLRYRTSKLHSSICSWTFRRTLRESCPEWSFSNLSVLCNDKCPTIWYQGLIEPPICPWYHIVRHLSLWLKYTESSNGVLLHVNELVMIIVYGVCIVLYFWLPSLSECIHSA